MTEVETARARLEERAARRAALLEGLAVSAFVTALVAAAAAFAPERWITTLVAAVFLGATWLFVWRRDDATVVASGLALGGLVLPAPLEGPALARGLGRALGFAALAALATFPLFVVGWALRHGTGFHLALGVVPDVLAGAPGQLVLVALPEEAFYRGYLQTRLDTAFPGRVRLLGAEVGLSLVVTSVVFALGHLATIHHPARLAVFFPSLLFGWLRARTKGIGAGVVFHATCNLFSETLARGLS